MHYAYSKARTINNNLLEGTSDYAIATMHSCANNPTSSRSFNNKSNWLIPHSFPTCDTTRWQMKPRRVHSDSLFSPSISSCCVQCNNQKLRSCILKYVIILPSIHLLLCSVAVQFIHFHLTSD